MNTLNTLKPEFIYMIAKLAVNSCMSEMKQKLGIGLRTPEQASSMLLATLVCCANEEVEQAVNSVVMNLTRTLPVVGTVWEAHLESAKTANAAPAGSPATDIIKKMMEKDTLL